MPFSSFADDGYDKVMNCMTTVRKRFKTNSHVVEEWESWFRRYGPPPSNLVEDYVAKVASQNQTISLPLRRQLFSPTYTHTNFCWRKGLLTDIGEEIDPGFKWPALLAAAMPSVASRFNPNPPLPRLFAFDHPDLQNLLVRYTSATSRYDTLLLI